MLLPLSTHIFTNRLSNRAADIQLSRQQSRTIKMSLNIKLELPIAAVLAIQDAPKSGSNARALRVSQVLTDQVVLDAIKEMPYVITPSTSGRNNITSTGDKTPDHMNPPQNPDQIKIYLKCLDGITKDFVVMHDVTVDNLKSTIFAWNGLPPDTQRLIYTGKQLEDGRELKDVCYHLSQPVKLLTHSAVWYHEQLRHSHGAPFKRLVARSPRLAEVGRDCGWRFKDSLYKLQYAAFINKGDADGMEQNHCKAKQYALVCEVRRVGGKYDRLGRGQ